MAINLDDYFSAGYYITKYITRTDWHSAELLPYRFLSVSDCIADIAPVIYWANSQEDFDTFGIEPTPEMQQWCNERFDKEIGFPDVIYHLETARDFIAKFIPPKDDLFLLGAGLHKDFIEPFLLVEPTLRGNIQDEGGARFGSHH